MYERTRDKRRLDDENFLLPTRAARDCEREGSHLSRFLARISENRGEIVHDGKLLPSTAESLSVLSSDHATNAN